MKKLPPKRRAETLVGHISAAHEMMAFSLRQVADAAAEYAFAVQCSMKTDEAMRADEMTQATISRARKS